MTHLPVYVVRLQNTCLVQVNQSPLLCKREEEHPRIQADQLAAVQETPAVDCVQAGSLNWGEQSELLLSAAWAAA